MLKHSCLVSKIVILISHDGWKDLGSEAVMKSDIISYSMIWLAQHIPFSIFCVYEAIF